MRRKAGIVFFIVNLLIFTGLGVTAASANEKEKKVVYLTFDDGPNTYTPKVLDVLKKKKAKATFFMIETNIKKNPKTVKRIIQEGHYPGLHSVSHDKKKLYFGSPTNVAKEMEKTKSSLKKVSGVSTNLTRVPYGSKPYLKKSFRDELVKKGFKMWDWNIDTLDWKYNRTNPDKIVSNVKSGLKKLEGKRGPVVILFHDSKGTAAVLPEIIDYLRKQGYTIEPYNQTQHVMVNFWSDKRL